MRKSSKNMLVFAYSMYGFDRFLGLISLEKGRFGGYWVVARKN